MADAPHVYTSRIDAILAAKALPGAGDVDVIEVPGGYVLGVSGCVTRRAPSVCRACGKVFYTGGRFNIHKACRRKLKKERARASRAASGARRR